MEIVDLMKVLTAVFALWSIPFLVILIKDIANSSGGDRVVGAILTALFALLLATSIFTLMISAGVTDLFGVSGHKVSQVRSLLTSIGTLITSIAFWKIHK